jgi:hypothetical protein
MAEIDHLSTGASGVEGAQEGGGLPGGQRPSAAKTQMAVWADELSGYAINGVAWLKARTTVRVLTVLRAVVYALIILVALVAAMVFFVIGLTRLWDVYVPIEPLGRRVYLSYIVVGGLFFIAGVVLLVWKRRSDDEAQ